MQGAVHWSFVLLNDDEHMKLLLLLLFSLAGYFILATTFLA